MNGTHRTHGGHGPHESYESRSPGHDNFSRSRLGEIAPGQFRADLLDVEFWRDSRRINFRLVDDSRVTGYAAIDGYTINRPP
jgi:hypothetical protein